MSSKIRVYELAKEAGVESKALAEKLIDLGYNIKSHSSTVDGDVADEIRRNVLGTATTKVVEKRISAASTGATVIRRRTKTVPVEPESEPETPPALDSEIEEEAAEVAAAAEAVEPAVSEEAVAAVEDEAEEAPPVAGEGPVVAEEGEEEAAAAEISESGEEEPAAATAEDQEAAAEEKPRRGLARVIKRAAIQIEAEPDAAARPARPRAAQPPKAKGRVEATAAPATEEAGDRAKKKGKRFVQIAEEEDRGAKRTAAGPRRKGKKVVGFEEISEFDEYAPRGGRRGKRKKEKPAPQAAAETKAIKKRIRVYESISVGDLAHRMGAKAGQVIGKLMGLGVMATVNQALDVDTAALVAADFGYEIEQAITEEMTVISLEEREGGGELVPRPPVVTVMGHVDHGKTSILDAIRQTDVAAGEAGGITQHIGAYHVRSSAGEVVFLDTPGHAAFTEMRARGSKVTDIVVLVVAADDGVMDQTKEAISHAQAAGVPIVVAVNKIDKPNADIMRVKRELSEHGLLAEDWGGDVIFRETSAKQKIGIEDLLSDILLQAEILELKADPNRKARGCVVEAQLHKGRGPVATVLVQEGTLRVGEPVVIGLHHGRVRSLTNDKGELIDEAGPAMPVEIQGLSGVPQAGDEFMVVTDEKMAKNVSSARQLKAREMELAASSKISLDKLFERMQEGEVKELRVVLRADVQGTLEAFGKAIEQLSTAEIKVRVLHEGTGTITESDVLLASASDAIIIGFNVRPTVKVKDLAGHEKVDIRSYDVIYHALDDIKKAMVGMLEPTFEERVIGAAEVRQTFSVPKVGTIAGCYVIDGKIERNAKVRLIREGVVVYTGSLASLKRFKDDVREVASGYECGMNIENYNDIKVGDVIEAFVMDEVEAQL